MELNDHMSQSSSVTSRLNLKSVNSENLHINTFVHLEGLELTDDFDNTESIDVLIGSDYYWDFVSGDPLKGVIRTTFLAHTLFKQKHYT